MKNEEREKESKKVDKVPMGRAKLTVNMLFVLGFIAILISYIFGVFIHKDWIVFGSGWVVAIILMTSSILLGRIFVKSGAIPKEELRDKYVDERTAFIQGKAAPISCAVASFAFAFLMGVCVIFDAGLWSLLLIAQYFALVVSYLVALSYFKRGYGG